MKNKDGYVITITIISIFFTVSLIINIILLVLTNDLSSKVQMQDNTLRVCKIDLEQVQNENEELKEKCIK